MHEHLRLCDARRICGEFRFEPPIRLLRLRTSRTQLLPLRRHHRELRLERERLRSADVLIGAQSDRLLLGGCASGRLALELQGPLGKLLLRRCELGLLGPASGLLSLQLLGALGKLLPRRGEIRLRYVAAQTAALTATQLVYTGEECIITSKGGGTYSSFSSTNSDAGWRSGLDAHGPILDLHAMHRSGVFHRARHALWATTGQFGFLHIVSVSRLSFRQDSKQKRHS
jgi:hypothetical protein